MVQVFRRAESIFTEAALPLHGLDPAAQYEITDVTTIETTTFTGAELMTKGLPVHMGERPEALVLSYKKTHK